MAMLAYSGRSDSLGAKLLTMHSGQEEGVSSHHAVVILVNPQSGELQAVSVCM